MKSVGEVMELDVRSSTKATQSLEIKRNGLGADGKDTPIMNKL
jgi:carbamoylphosphate synthase large subunit